MSKLQIFLSLRFSEIPLDVFLRDPALAGSRLDVEPCDGGKEPLCVVVSEHNKIHSLNPVATRAGLKKNMLLTSAYALEPELLVVKRQREKEKRAVQNLASWANQFTPDVSLKSDNGLLLHVTDSLRLFKGLGQLIERVSEGLELLGFNYAYGISHTPESAWLLSFYPELMRELDLGSIGLHHQLVLTNDFFMRELIKVNISHLDFDSKQKEQLSNINVHTLYDLLQLPISSLRKRFGGVFVEKLNKLIGNKPDQLKKLNAKKMFSSEIDFLYGIRCVDFLYPALEKLIHEFSRFLTARQYHCRLFVWRFIFYNHTYKEVNVEFSQPQNSTDNFLSMSLLKLEPFKISMEIEAVQIYSRQIVDAHQQSYGLFKEIPCDQASDKYVLLDKLISRLGKDKVYAMKVNNEHLPELQYKKLDIYSQSGSLCSSSANPKIGSANKPLWILPNPEPIRFNFYLISGPERIDSHWWDKRQWRDYFVARNKFGVCYWVYFDNQTSSWFVHGVYS